MSFVTLVVAALVLAAPQPDAATEREARQIETMLVAPCCWTQQVSVHGSAAASEIKEDIRERLAAGMSRQQILDAYVARYGNRILTVPPARGFNLTLYVLPPLLLLLSAAVLVWLIRRMARPAIESVAVSPPLPGSDDPYAARLHKDLRDLD